MVAFRAGQCSSLFLKANCLSLPGCQWSGTDAKCQEDQAAVIEAISASPRLAFAAAQTARCQLFNPCVSPCGEADSGECIYRPLANATEWFLPNATSTFCQYMKLGFGCVFAPADSTCTGACEIDEEGECDLSDKGAVEFLYGSSEAEKAKWLDAAEACSAIKDPDECSSFTGGR
eukprot:evm.model.scf_3239.1 EVM.evm.TU.scf_3239.1   scf_3239:3073-5756(+)